MPATEQISETLIRDNIERAVSHVLKTMLGLDSKLASAAVGQKGPVGAETIDSTRPHVVGTVGFLGDVNGLIYLHLDLEFAKLGTCHLLGMTADELAEAGDEVINDAIGELTNMTVGSFKNGLNDSGYVCKLTIPSILRGSNFTIEPIGTAARYVYHFDCAGHRIVTDILINLEE
jgi:chemotaxis protein CheX